MNLLELQNFEAYVAGCAATSNVRVVWDEPDATPRTDGKTIWMPAVTSKSGAEWLTRMRYFIKHETSHVVHSDFDYLNKVKPQGLLALLNNLIEDHRIDYRNDNEFKGDADVSNEFWKLYANDVRAFAESDDHELRNDQVLVMPVFMWDAMCRTWITSNDMIVSEFNAQATPDNYAKLEKLASYTDELVRVREEGNAEDVMALAEAILRDVFEQDPEKYKNNPDFDEQSDGGTAKGKGDKESDEEGGDTDKEDRLISVKKLRKELSHTHESSRTGIHWEIDKLTHGSYALPNKHEYVIIDFNKSIPADVECFLSYSSLKKSSVTSYITSNARHMANKLRIKLQTRSRSRYEYGKKKGKLHNGSLYRLSTGSDEIASRVFRQKVVSDTLDTAVCLLVDCSGSMSGNKFDMACAGAGALAESLKPLNIAYSVYGFTNTCVEEHPIVWLFSEFGEKVPTSELINRFDIASKALMQNSDGDAIAYATSRLMGRKEHRKVLLVLSDGSPAGREHAGDIVAYTAQTIKDAESMGIDVYGVGIRDNNVQRFYKNHTVVDNLNDLSPTILSIIDRSM